MDISKRHYKMKVCKDIFHIKTKHDCRTWQVQSTPQALTDPVLPFTDRWVSMADSKAKTERLRKVTHQVNYRDTIKIRI